jgi:parallel beta-helix repeat protein
MKVVKAFLGLIIILSLFNSASGKIIYIPSPSLATIQGGINYASDGDTVLVNSGTYYENINFKGKKIVVASTYLMDSDTSQINSTIIDATYKPSSPVVTFTSREDSLTILTGFTIQNSTNAWGVLCDSSSSPVIIHNLIKNNNRGLVCTNSSNPTVRDNTLLNNTDIGLFGEANSSPLIQGNTLSGHQTGMKFTSGAPLIQRNVVTQSAQKGISITGASPQVFNNTVANNTGDGVEIISSSGVNLKNNIVVSSSSGTGIKVSSSSLDIGYNDVWNNAGGNFSGTPLGVGNLFWGKNQKAIPCDQFYNISQEPKFESPPADFSLQCSSPCIDIGDPSFPVPPAGGPRIDMGAFEYLIITGDADSNGKIDISDVVYLINYCYKSGPGPNPVLKGDVTADGLVNAADIIHLINYLFRFGMPPCH